MNIVQWQPGMTLDELEKEAILAALQFYKTKVDTAKALGMGARTLDYKLEAYEKQAYDAKLADIDAQTKRDRDLAYAKGEITTQAQVENQAQANPSQMTSAAVSVAAPTVDDQGIPVHVPQDTETTQAPVSRPQPSKARKQKVS